MVVSLRSKIKCLLHISMVFSIANSCTEGAHKERMRLKTLPNQQFLDMYHADPDSYYKKTLEAFETRGFDFNPLMENLKPVWPLVDDKPSLMTRYGTPTVVASDTYKVAYLHEALDIKRSSAKLSDRVLAPVSGMALVVKESNDDYSTGVVIYNPESRLLISLFHVNPDASLAAATTPVEVKQGQTIGTLAPVESIKDEFKEAYKHIHLSVIDLKNKTLLNPLKYFGSVGKLVSGVEN